MDFSVSAVERKTRAGSDYFLPFVDIRGVILAAEAKCVRASKQTEILIIKPCIVL